MKQLTLDQFLALGWSTSLRQKLQGMADSGIAALVAWDNAGKMSASAYTEEPPELPETTVAVWRRQPLPPSIAETMKSRTQQAVELVLSKGVSPHAAAKQLGVHASAVYRAITRAKQKTLCPCCGQVVREGFTVKVPKP